MSTELPSSSPGELSSPPKSPDSPAGAIVLAPTATSAVAYPDLSAAALAPTNGNGPVSSTASKNGAKKDDGADKAPRKRRARPSATDGKDEESSKPAKVPRKRAPKRPKEPVVTSAPPSTTPAVSTPSAVAPAVSTGAYGSSVPSPAVAPATLSAAPIPRPASRQQKITDIVHPEHRPTANHTASPSQLASALYRPTTTSGADPHPRPPFQSEHSHSSVMSSNNIPSPRSGQRYDPIRSSTMEDRPYSAASTPAQTSPTKMQNRASASPSISSLIDPPSSAGNAYTYSPPNRPSPATLGAVPHHSPSNPNAVLAQTKTSLLSANSPKPVAAVPAQASTTTTKHLDPADAMEIDSDRAGPAKHVSRKTSVSNTNPPSKASSPKPGKKEKDKAATPPLPPLPGSGAIASLFGGAVDTTTGPAPTVVLNIPLNGETNKYINFARLAEERYGFNALHPRLAAQRERLARVAAAGAALENNNKGSGASADDMSLDGSDNEQDLSTLEANGPGTGTGGPGSAAGDVTKDGTPGPKPRKKRQMKEDQYDKGDPFVDDSELVWEEQAAASKDGFFVYSGPLIPEGETARVERADGTIIKPPGVGRGRGRGRGGGPGSRGGAAGRGTGTGGGPGSRGGATTRKPRMKRGERAALEAAKKEEREKEKAAKAEGKTEVKSEGVKAEAGATTPAPAAAAQLAGSPAVTANGLSPAPMASPAPKPLEGMVNGAA